MNIRKIVATSALAILVGLSSSAVFADAGYDEVIQNEFNELQWKYDNNAGSVPLHVLRALDTSE